MRVSGRAAWLILSIALLCGCSKQAAATEDLIQSLSEAHSAIASSILGIELYDQQRSTRAVTETLLGDMAEQIVDAERALEPVSIDSEKAAADRDAALAAVHAGVAAVRAGYGGGFHQALTSLGSSLPRPWRARAARDALSLLTPG